MSKVIKAIELTFENLDWIEIPAEYFGIFSIRAIHTTVERVACNAILQRSYCDYVEFELLRSIEEVFPTLQEDIFYDPIAGPGFLDRVAERKDLTHITLRYTDGNEEQYAVPWKDGKNTHYNQLQKTLHLDTQALSIAIGNNCAT